MLKSKLRIFSFIVLIVTVAAGLLSVRYKYQVKEFVKSNSVLYEWARKVASIKHAAGSFFSDAQASEPEYKSVDRPIKNWRFVFDASQSLGRYDRFWGSLGYESFKNGILNSRNRRLFEMIAETNSVNPGSFRYVRAHNLFSDGEPPWGEGCVSVSLDDEGNVVCDWTTTDEVFDRIVSTGLRPIVELGFMPDALASIPKRRQRWGGGNISPPNDYSQWQDLIYQTVKHFCERYGEDEVSKWYFEVWNEPDLAHLFWVPEKGRKNRGDLQEYLKLYDYAVYGAKKACARIRVGGPASAGGYIDGLMEHVVLEKNYAGEMSATRIDFVSSHAYGFLSETNKRGMNLPKAIQWKLNRAFKHDHRDVRRGSKKLPFLLTETGFGKKKGLFHNDRFMAAWLTKFVAMSFYLRDEFGSRYQPSEVVLWSNSQIAKDFAPQRGVAASLKSPDGREVFKRPIYNAMEALGYLSDERIRLTTPGKFGDEVFGLATKNKAASVEILLYHLNERDQESASADSFTVSLSVRNLPFTEYSVQEFLIDETHSNVYTAWQRMGAPRRLSKPQIDVLSSADDLVQVGPASTATSEDRAFQHQLELQSNSVALIVLRNNET